MRLAGLMSRWTTPSAVGVVERLGRLDAQPGDRTKVRPGETPRPCVIADRICPLSSVQVAFRAANQRDGRGKASRPGGVADEPGIHAVGPRAGELLGVPTHLAHELRQAPPVDILHGVEMDPPVAAGREDRHDVGMVELGRGLGLDQEPLPLPGIDRRGEGQDLEGDPAAEGDLLAPRRPRPCSRGRPRGGYDIRPAGRP